MCVCKKDTTQLGGGTPIACGLIRDIPDKETIKKHSNKQQQALQQYSAASNFGPCCRETGQEKYLPRGCRPHTGELLFVVLLYQLISVAAFFA